MSDPIRLGVLYFSAGQKVPVERGSQNIGHTVYDKDLGQHVFWFASIKEFEIHGGKITAEGRVVWPRDVFEGRNPVNKPVPVIQLLHGGKVEGTAPEITPKDEACDVCGVVKHRFHYPATGTTCKECVTKPLEKAKAAMLPPVPTAQSLADVPPAQPLVAVSVPVEVAKVTEGNPTEAIFLAHAGRRIRIKEFAAELAIDPETLQLIISQDSRYAPIVAGWVRLASDTATVNA